MTDADLVVLSAGAVANARAWADATFAVSGRHRPELNFRDDRFFYGYIGEQGARRWLQLNDTLHRHRVSLTARGEISEFIVWRNGNPQLLEIKASTKAEHLRFMAPMHQALHADLFLGARIESRDPYTVRIMGWLWRSQVEALPVAEFGHGPTRWKFYKEMRPTEEFLAMLDNVRIITAA